MYIYFLKQWLKMKLERVIMTTVTIHRFEGASANIPVAAPQGIQDRNRAVGGIWT
jgi:hypothetical protein